MNATTYRENKTSTQKQDRKTQHKTGGKSNT